MQKEIFTKEQTQVLKGIAILYVLLGHMGYLDTAGAWGVHIFLFVSGYGVYCSAQKGMKDFWQKKVVKVFLPYLIFTSIFIFVRLILGEKLSFSTVFISIFGLDFGKNVDSTMWYISYLFSWYAVFWFGWHSWKKSKRGCVICSVIIWLSMVFAGYKGWIWHNRTIAWAYAFSFPMGIFVGIIRNWKINKKIIKISTYVIGAVSTFVVIMDYGKKHVAFDLFFFTCAASLLTVCAVMMLPGKLIGNRIIRFFGKYSYGMYLNEGFLLNYKEILFPFANRHIQNIVLLVCSIGLAVLMELVAAQIIKFFINKKTRIIKK